jgi:hypothetical protein
LEAVNWLAALGEGLARLGVEGALERVACESLPNGQVLVRDVRTGRGFVVHPLDGAQREEPTEQDELLEAPSETDEVAGVFDRGEADVLLAGIEDAGSDADAIARAIDVACRLVPSSGAAWLAVEGEVLRFKAASGPHALMLKDLRMPADAGIAGWCVRRKSAISARDPYQDDRFYRSVDEVTGFRTDSLVAVPGVVDGIVLGCLELVNRVGAPSFSRADMVTAETVASALSKRLATGR